MVPEKHLNKKDTLKFMSWSYISEALCLCQVAHWGHLRDISKNYRIWVINIDFCFSVNISFVIEKKGLKLKINLNEVFNFTQNLLYYLPQLYHQGERHCPHGFTHICWLPYWLVPPTAKAHLAIATFVIGGAKVKHFSDHLCFFRALFKFLICPVHLGSPLAGRVSRLSSYPNGFSSFPLWWCCCDKGENLNFYFYLRGECAHLGSVLVSVTNGCMQRRSLFLISGFMSLGGRVRLSLVVLL